MLTVPTATRTYLDRWIASAGAQPPLILVGNANNLPLRELVKEIKLTAVCTAAAKHRPCRNCQACHLAEHDAHPDSIDMSPAVATWRIADVRQLRRRLARTSLVHTRLVVLREAEQFTGPAAPALLKMLEEPAAATRYLLVTAWPRRLLPTILSRCQILRYKGDLPPADAQDTAFSLDFLLQKISRKSDTGLTEDDILHIGHLLAVQLRNEGPTPQLRRAFLRLRDYYLITSRHGNAKLAGDVVVLSVPTTDGMS